MTSILSLWNAIVGSAAVLAIVGIAIGLMIGMIDARRAFGRLGAVLAILVLPPILVGLWQSLSLWQQFGIIILLGLLVVVFFLRGTRLRSKRGGGH